MTRLRETRGFTLLEMLISITVLLLVGGGLFTLMVQNSRLNKSQQLIADTQSTARNCLAMVVQTLRSAGWDPTNAGLIAIIPDPDLADGVSQIEIFADLNADGVTALQDEEQTLIRHRGTQVEWRPTSDTSVPFTVLAGNISNDADGDGNIEPMFRPDDPLNPTRVTVQITAQSTAPDPTTGQVVRYTLASDVILRNQL